MLSDRDILKSREYIRDQRKQVIATNIPLTPDEATKFWPIYDRYMQETIKINDARWTMMKEYADNYDNLTDPQAQDYVKKSAKVDQQLLELRLKYVPMFEKVISPKKTALWYQIDRRMDLVLNWQIALLVPFVEANK